MLEKLPILICNIMCSGLQICNIMCCCIRMLQQIYNILIRMVLHGSSNVWYHKLVGMFAFNVSIEVAQLRRPMLAKLAIVRLFTRVGPLMSRETVSVSERFAAIPASAEVREKIVFALLVGETQRKDMARGNEAHSFCRRSWTECARRLQKKQKKNSLRNWIIKNKTMNKFSIYFSYIESNLAYNFYNLYSILMRVMI